MKIAVISDLHDNLMCWERIVSILKDQNISVMINCGDTCAPAMVREMSATFPGQIHTVFGNVADRERETALVPSLKNMTHYGDRGEVTLENRKITFNHFPNVAEKDAASGEYDLVCFGHTHLKRNEKVGSTWLLNPGTAAGMFQYPSFAIVDLATMTGQFIDITL